MSQHRDEYLDLCAGYAIGSLDEADRLQLERHLAEGCPVCEEALEEFSEASMLLAASAPVARPSPMLRQRVLTVIAGTSKAPPTRDGLPDRGRVIEMKPRRSSANWLTWSCAAAAALLAVMSLMLWGESARLRKELDGNHRRLTELSTRLTEAQQLNAILSAPGARVAVLDLTPAGQLALQARATYDPASRSAVLVFDHFSAPAGRDYELWAIRGGHPASLGLIRPDESGHVVMRIENVGESAVLTHFAVSLERAGGSPDKNAPAGPVVMLGKLSG